MEETVQKEVSTMTGKDRTYSPYIDLVVIGLLPDLPDAFDLKALCEKIIESENVILDESEITPFTQRIRHSVKRLASLNKVEISHTIKTNIAELLITKTQKNDN